MVLFLPGMNKSAECIEQRIQRVMLVGAHFINEAIEPVHRQFIVLLTLNFEESTHLGPRSFKLWGNDTHVIHLDVLGNGGRAKAGYP